MRKYNYVLFCEKCCRVFDKEDLEDYEMPTDKCPECGDELWELDLWDMASEYADLKTEIHDLEMNRSRLIDEIRELRLQIENSKRE